VLCRRATVRDDGDAESEKSALGLVTTRDTVVVCTRAPLVPVIVRVLEPVGVVALVVTVIVDDRGAAETSASILICNNPREG